MLVFLLLHLNDKSHYVEYITYTCFCVDPTIQLASQICMKCYKLILCEDSFMLPKFVNILHELCFAGGIYAF